MYTETQTKRSFRNQLNITITLGFLTLAIVSSLTTAWVTRINLKNQLFSDAHQVTDTLAAQSELALLYHSPENAKEAVNAAMGFPAVIQVMIADIDGSVLLTKGKPVGGLPNISNYNHDNKQALMIKETSSAWVFVAPVYAANQFESYDNILLQEELAPKPLLGHVLISISKLRFDQAFNLTATNNLGISLIVTFFILFIIGQSFKRLTNPLKALSSIMAQTARGEDHTFASSGGPKEVADIARAYNKMIQALAKRDAQLRQHNELLELEVAERTKEVVFARDAAIEANRNKSYFLSSVTHELRTPLQAIIGFSDLILETLPPESNSVRDDTNTIVNNANHLLDMIESILDMSKIESGGMNLNIASVDLNQLIQNTINTTRPLIEKNNNHLITEIDIVSDNIEIDEDKIRQITLNLLSNACKFTENGEITLTALLTEKAFKLTVHDTGIGIDNNHIEHIFEAFYQIDQGTTRRYQGSGLGLAISHQFCKMMGGNIEVKSSLNKGTTFYVVIPIPLKINKPHADG